MALRFFIDHCVPTSIIESLEDAEHDVFRLRDHIPATSPDPVVIETVQQFAAILISLNGDFCDIVTYPPSQYKGIISLQIKNHPEIIPDLFERLHHYFDTHTEMSDYTGKLLIVEVHRIRSRM